MDPRGEPLRLYGRRSDLEPPSWAWAETQLREAATYWVIGVPRPGEHPHPRPVWGVWSGGSLHLSIGSPVVRRQLADDDRLTVHLDSGVAVVVLEGSADTERSTDAAVLERYRTKYDSSYDVAEYGQLTVVQPTTVLAWRAAGWAGRDGFRQSGKWRFDGPG
jgi:hypothetical protein